MENGGNGPARGFFRQHGAYSSLPNSNSSKFSPDIYDSRAAQLYRQKLRDLAEAGSENNSKNSDKSGGVLGEMSERARKAALNNKQKEQSSNNHSNNNNNDNNQRVSSMKNTTKPAEGSPMQLVGARRGGGTNKRSGMATKKVSKPTDDFFADFDSDSDEDDDNKSNEDSESDEENTPKYASSSRFAYEDSSQSSSSSQRSSGALSLNKNNNRNNSNKREVKVPKERLGGDTFMPTRKKNLYNQETVIAKPSADTYSQQHKSEPREQKSMSSTTYFGEDQSDERDHEVNTQLLKFEGATSISSSDFHSDGDYSAGNDEEISELARRLKETASGDFGQVKQAVSDSGRRAAQAASEWLQKISQT